MFLLLLMEKAVSGSDRRKRTQKVRTMPLDISIYREI
jgi:hypothetical protein